MEIDITLLLRRHQRLRVLRVMLGVFSYNGVDVDVFWSFRKMF